MVYKIMFSAAVIVLTLISIAYILPDQWLEARPIVLFATDILSVLASVATVFYGTRILKRYGGTIGAGMSYCMAAIFALGLFELLDMLQRLQVAPFTSLFSTVGPFRMQNIFITTTMLLFLYGVWKMRGE